MDIEDFVKQVLAQITNSVNNNKDGGDIVYAVNYDSGVDFDLAVTTTQTSTKDKGKSAGLKIRVVGADVSSKYSAQSSQEVTSRVKFNVHLRRETNHRLRA